MPSVHLYRFYLQQLTGARPQNFTGIGALKSPWELPPKSNKFAFYGRYRRKPHPELPFPGLIAGFELPSIPKSERLCDARRPTEEKLFHSWDKIRLSAA